MARSIEPPRAGLKPGGLASILGACASSRERFMLFAIICTDKPASLDLRQATRPRHLDYWKSHAAHVIQAGPLLDAAGQPIGSLLILDAASRAAVEALAAADPYVQAELFESTLIRPFRSVFRDGQMLA